MKKGFTLIELVLVVLIIGILSASIGKMFSFKNTYRFKYDTCYIRTISDINNFFTKALLQKQVYTGGTYTGVKNYQILFNIDKQYMALVYSGVGTGKVIHYFGTGIDDINECYYPPYHTYISGENLKIIIQGGLSLGVEGVNSKQAVAIYTGDSTSPGKIGTTGEILFYRCNSPGTKDCYEKNKLVIDSKTYLFKNYFCRKLNLNTGKCEVWSK